MQCHEWNMNKSNSFASVSKRPIPQTACGQGAQGCKEPPLDGPGHDDGRERVSVSYYYSDFGPCNYHTHMEYSVLYEYL
jgi:hypothetical protein